MNLVHKFVQHFQPVSFEVQTTTGSGGTSTALGEAVDYVELGTRVGKYGIGLIIMVVLIVAIKKIMGGGSKVSTKGLTRADKKEIRRLERAGDIVGAGDVAMQAGAFDTAAELYLQANNPRLAGEAYLQAKRTKDAVRAFRKGNQRRRAAELLEELRQYTQAADEYRQLGDDEKAGKLYLKGGEGLRAAECFRNAGLLYEAGNGFAKAGADAKAQDAYNRYFEEQYELVRGQIERVPEALEAAKYVARYERKAGKPALAADILEKAKLFEEAAAARLEAGDQQAATELFVKAGRPDEAARLAQQSGNAGAAARFRAEAALDAGDRAGAAREFARAGLFERSGELFHTLGEYKHAGEMYAKAKDFQAAADSFATAGDMARAAAAYEHGKSFMQAADIYHNLGDTKGEMRCLAQGRSYLRLGEMMQEMGKTQEALAAYQKVDQLSDDFEVAALRQADILVGMGQHDVAFSKYRQAAGNASVNADNADLFYKMALAASQMGDLGTALDILERVVAANYYHADAQTLVKKLRGQVGQRGAGGLMRSQTVSSSAYQARGLVPQAAMRYEVIEEVARGGMGIVYKAKDTTLNRVVAFKILSEQLKSNETAVRYFLQEARAVAALSHPNIVTVYDAGEQDGEFYMAMEFISGRDLKDILKQKGKFNEDYTRYILRECLTGLGYVHERGIVHRDIKSSNIMLTRDRRVKIMDFGLAKVLEEAQSQHTKAIGTPYYMSPEQIVGNQLDARSDLYSLGITIFECATGEVPFPKGEMAYHHLHTPPPSPRQLNPALSQQLEQIILKLIAKKPEDRFQKAEDALRYLR